MQLKTVLEENNMIRLVADITNPFYKTRDDTAMHNFVYKHWSNISKNKSAELQIAKFGDGVSLLKIVFDLNFKGSDHAGPQIEISFWRYMFDLHIYDHRHWDYRTNNWEIYNNE
jgi:hypothetical protein